MKIAIDIHGVLNKIPKFFNLLSNGMCSIEAHEGYDDEINEIHILTGITHKAACEEIFNLGDIYYDHIYSITDHLLELGLSTGKNNKYGRPIFPEEAWDKAKADYCELHEIDIIFDDTERYMEYFKDIKTKFVLIKI